MYMSHNNQSRDRIGKNIAIDEFKFERIREFNYFGTKITEDNNGSQEINNRIQVGTRCLFALQNLIKSKQLTRRTMIQIYKTIIRPVVMYGSQTWTITKANEEGLFV
ncbi:unnamed protein product [Diabrotica balteata]|uniref:Uncharacterized protein n=1 Tax=Diabrotica balteata TaxID=107213 RepID=A0A9N9T4E8_DIABA|nr:unnamed protein product [Diabrotica balteata]